jgi:acyl dehydratase
MHAPLAWRPPADASRYSAEPVPGDHGFLYYALLPQVSTAMPVSTFQTPASDRWFEDYEVGATYVLGTFSLSEAEIIEFASRFDPQPFHLDAEAARASHYGGIIASGWHTGSATMRLMVEHFISASGGLGSPGLDEIRWIKPVRPDMVLRVQVSVLDGRRSVSKPDRGFFSHFIEVLNLDGEPVMTIRGKGMVRVRPTLVT